VRRTLILTSDEAEALREFGHQVRRARLRRNMSQAELAERTGVTRKVVVAMEAGAQSSGLAFVAKVLAVFGYAGRLGDLLKDDPIGEDLVDVHGRQRARRRDDGVADF
ncbi:MAG: helix-turn-helix transcriptional regulator, partial [Rhodospirillaceae bacterium]